MVFVVHLVMSDSLGPHALQHARFPCPSPPPGACSNSCPLSYRCHPAISSSVIPFSSCPQFFPASGSFPVSPLFASGGQSIGASASISVLHLIKLTLTPHASPIASGTHPSAFCLHELQLAFPCKRSPSSLN